MIEIQVNYDARTDAYRINETGNGRAEGIVQGWHKFEEYCFENYAGKEINISIFCWTADMDRIEEIRRKKSELMKRINSGCQNPDIRCPCPQISCGQ